MYLFVYITDLECSNKKVESSFFVQVHTAYTETVLNYYSVGFAHVSISKEC